MRELGNVFSSEMNPIHEPKFKVSSVLEVTGATAGTIVKAGTLLASKGAGATDTIKMKPEAGCSVEAGAGTTKTSGILSHDVVIEDGKTEYTVGVLVQGVVYEDAVKNANGNADTSADAKEALLKQGILFYNVKTIKKR